MNENYEKEFNIDVATKKTIARSARHKVTHSGCTLPSDTMSVAEKERKNSPCREYDMAKPWNWAEFTSAPHDIQYEYLMGLRKRYSITKNQLPELFRCTQLAVDTYLKSQQLAGVLPSGFKDNIWSCEAEWKGFAQSLFSRGSNVTESAVHECLSPKQALAAAIEDAKKMGISQAMLGRMIGVSPCYISQGKSGRLSDAASSSLIARIQEARKKATEAASAATYATEYKPLGIKEKPTTKPAAAKDTVPAPTRKPKSAKLALLNDVKHGELYFDGTAGEVLKQLQSWLSGSNRKVAVKLSFE